MFGLVPKPIWSKLIPPDDRNAIPQNANILLVELDDGRKGLVDTGCGNADWFSEQERKINGLGPGWPLMESLLKQLDNPEREIQFIILTHLHWDHAGGVGNHTTLAFPNAEILVHEKEWEDATSGNPLLFKSYPATTLAPLQAHQDKIRFIQGDDSDIFPGIRSIRSSGHTRGHSTVLFDTNPYIASAAGPFIKHEMALFAADVCPTQHHLRLVFQTAYDTFPLETRAWKQKWLPKLADQRGVLLFDHDPDLFGATIVKDAKREFSTDQPLIANR